jgi:DNA polymerase-3 subunit alpha
MDRKECFVPLHVKSHYSLGCGTASVRKLVDRAAALGLPAIGLTDLENLYGQVVFHRLARARGIRPITGVELRGAEGHDRLVLLVRNHQGYANLCRIITRRRLEEACDPLAAISGLCDGLFILTDSLVYLERLLSPEASAPEVDRSALRLLLVRRRSRGVERGRGPAGPWTGQARPTDSAIEAASRRFSIPLVADLDIVFLDPEDHALQKLLTAIHQNRLLSEVEELGLAEDAERYFRSPRECDLLFGDLPEALRESRRLAEECDLDLTRGRGTFPALPIFPALHLPAGETAYSHLARRCLEGLRERYGGIHSQPLGRLTSELQVIEQLGFCEYFITVGEIIRFARSRRIEVVGRGSGAGSLVAYVLGVTNVDPLVYRLHFERFLHPGRCDLPDIDIDLCWIRRDEVIDFVYRTYGSDRVAMVSSHLTYQPRSAFREALKAFGVAPRQAQRLCNSIPHLHEDLVSRTPLRDLISASPGGRNFPFDEEPVRSALPLAERLLNLPHHLSVHSGGIVIGDGPLDTHVPLERAAKGVVITQYDKDSVEDIGLVKIDLLGNRCLTELQETIDQLGRSGFPLEMSAIPDRDPRTIEILRAGETVGCFQLESPAMRNLLRRMRPASIRDCIAAVALIRPGAAGGGAKESYIRRIHGEEPVVYHHPSLRGLLEESLGTVLYEEDVMCIASIITGSSLAEGDTLRSALKKCRHPDDGRDLENSFLRQAIQRGIEPHTASAVWQDLRRFASYCFSKAHAAGYGVLAYQSAYLKAHFPVEFSCALLNNHAGMYSTRTIAEEVKRQGVRLLPPCINRSLERFTVEDGPEGKAVRTGLARVKGLSEASRRTILARRPFRSLLDFVRRSPIPRREIEALVLAGAFDHLSTGGAAAGRTTPNHPRLLWELETIYEKEIGRGSLGFVSDEDYRLEYPPLEDYSPWERIQKELDILEMSLSGHPLELLREDLRKEGVISTTAARSRPGERIQVAGLLAAARKVRTSKGPFLQFVTIEDEEGLLEATLFPKVYERYGKLLTRLGPYVFKGRLEVDHGAPNLIVSAVSSPRSPGTGPGTGASAGTG